MEDAPDEDWMGHVDALEIHRVNKFQWTARQYYYGLLQTLRAVALLTANSLEEELVENTEVTIVDVARDPDIR